MPTKSVKEGFQEAFQFFLEDFEFHCRKVTIDSWSGKSYFVELFEDGFYRILWSGDLENLYCQSGILLSIPPIAEGDWNDDPALTCYENARQEMIAKFQEAISKIDS